MDDVVLDTVVGGFLGICLGAPREASALVELETENGIARAGADEVGSSARPAHE
jgi:hypothetical protein